MPDYGSIVRPEDNVSGTPAVPDAEEDPNEYSYVVNKFGRPKGTPRWNHMAATSYLSDDDALEWIEMGGPRA